jgi:ribonucleoside-diphosphate reductase alpha chain
MERFDLAHVDPTEGGFDALGKGIEEGKPAPGASRYVSKGLTRSRTDKLAVVGGGTDARGTTDTRSSGSGNVTALHTSGATALKTEPEAKLSPAQALEQLPWQQPQRDAKAQEKAQAAEKRAEARAKGYEGEACGECGNFTLVRNGTCLKCDTCGGTTGCS